jgi:hypothetical protein
VAKRIVDSLAAQGFRIVTQNRDIAELVGPGMRSSRQNALVGASKVTIRTLGREVAIEANFGAVRRLIRILGTVLFGIQAEARRKCGESFLYGSTRRR